MSKSTYILKKTWRVFLFILLGIFSILLLAMVFINLPMGKTVVKNRVQSYLRDKLHTQVSIGSIDYSLPEWLEIKNVYIEDQHHDTLAYGEEISVDLNMVKLAFGKTDIQKIYLKNILLNINRKETDTAFNYLFVMDAFTGNKSSTAIPDTAALKLTLDRLVFDDVALRFQDQKTGNDFKARIDTLNVTLDVFQPDRVQFYINDFYARGINFNMKTYKDIIIDTLTKRVIDTTVVTPAYALFLKAANINLYDLNVDVSNTIDGMQYANNIQHIKLTHSIINLQHSIATADSLTLDSSFVKFVSPLIASKNPDTTAMVPWYLKLAHLDMKDNQVEFTDNTKPKAGGFDPFHMKLQQLSTNIDDFHYSADTLTAKIKDLHFKDENGFSIDSLHLSYLQTAAQLSATEIYLKTPQSLIQDQVIVNFDTVSATRSAREKNSTVSANINNSIIAFNDLYQLMPSMKSTLPPSKFANLSLRVNTELRGNLQHIYLPYLQLSGLTGSSLAAHGNLYNISDPERFSYDIYIEKSRITKTDLLKFMPAGNEAAMRKIPQVFSLTGRIQGDKNNITADINTSAPGASFSGIIALHNVSNPDKLDYDINLRSTDISRDFILAFMPAGSLPPQISLPDRINASGLIKGTSNSLTLNAKLKTSYGNATAKGYINNFKNPEAAVYDMDLNLASFNLGKLLGQSPTLGLATGKLVAKGKGFNYKTMVADISGNLAAFSYNGYTYTNVDVVSAFNRGIITSSGNVRDPNLRMAYNLTANVRGEYPALDAWSRVDTIRLLPLHLYTDTLDASFTANIHATDTRPRHLDLQANLDSTYLNTGSQQFYLDSMSLAGTNQDGVDDISFQAPFGFVHANGAFDYDKIGTSLSQYVNHYYHFNKAAPANVPDQQISFEAEIRKNPIVLYVVPGLQDYENISFNSSYSSAYGDSALNFKASAPYLVYQDMVVRNGKADINSRNEKLNYNVSLDTLVYMANKFYGSRVKGYAANDSLAINATTQDSQARDWFGANATLSINGEEYTARLNDNLLLNYETWKVAPDNYILYSPQGIIVNNFMMRSDTSSISIASRQLVRNSPIDINIDNFNLKSISSFTSSDTLLVQGILDAKLLVSNLDKKLPAVTGNAQVKDFAFMQQPVGDITANLVEQSADVVAGNIAVTGNGNDIYADGKYFLNNTNEQIAVNIDVRRLTMQTLQGFMGGFIRNSSGAVSGNVVLSGKVADPKWKGEINFDSSRFVLSEYGSALTINNQKIILDHPVIRFNNFIVQDSLNHPLRVDGTITAKSFSEFGLDLSLDTKNFIVVNNPNTLTNEIYGFASVDANMKITGNSTSPDIEGNVKLNDNSNLTIVIPEQNYNKDAAIPVVRFIDRDTFNIDPPKLPFTPSVNDDFTFGKYLNYNFNIEVTKASTLSIILDPSTGDKVVMQGDGQLNAGVDPGGNLVLAGNYELDNGEYELNYQFIQRKFKLQKGSIVSFGGEPMNARVNITAVYVANTAPKDLLSNEITDISPTLSNSLNQKIPFRVVLYLTGILSKPDIAFDIQLPDENSSLNGDLRTTVENKLIQLRGDEAATNKQVFSLLLLNRFVGEQSSDFFKGNGGGFSDLARQSVSQFLSEALNEIAANLFKGIDIDLNLNSYRDFSNGGNRQKTDLNVTLSKTFLDNRLTVSVGTNIGIEGANGAGKAGTNSNSFMPDVSVAYKLTKDGRYAIRAYRKNQYEVVLDGYVVENGVSFIVTMDYDKFYELFRKKK